MVWEVRGQWGGAMNPAFYGLGGVNHPRLVDKLPVDFQTSCPVGYGQPASLAPEQDQEGGTKTE